MLAPTGPGHPLRGLRWGLLLAVAAALVLFAGVLVVSDGRSGPPSAATLPPAPTVPAPTPEPSDAGAPAPDAPGTLVSRGTPVGGWETRGWSWDSAVRPGAAGPEGMRAVAVTYRSAWGGFALRQGTGGRPAPGATLQVRVYVPGLPVRLGLQVQSADDGGTGAVAARSVPSRRWVTLTATAAELKPPAGVRRVALIGQDVPVGTMVWVSDVTLR